ncbi:MAG TPA: hypothetical protein VF351_10065 [Actinomycetota bacterium]
MSPLRRTVLLSVSSLVVLASVLATTAPAATPSETPDDTSMVDGPVRAAVIAGGHVWIGGNFSNVLGPNGSSPTPAGNLAALSLSTGLLSTTADPPALIGGTGAQVRDMSLGPDGVLYVTGRFLYRFGGVDRRHTVGLDPVTGRIVRGFTTIVGRTVLAGSARIYVGGSRLRAYLLDGRRDAGFADVVPSLDRSIRLLEETPQILDLDVMPDGDLVAAGHFDFVNGRAQKVAAKVTPTTGAVRSWSVAGVGPSSKAFGISTEVQQGRLLVGAGGSDFAALYAPPLPGADPTVWRQVWKTDTSGSAQAVAVYDADTVLVGGHFDTIAHGPREQCGSNQVPIGDCLAIPRLAAVDRSTGITDATWRPNPCCHYLGVWAIAVRKGRAHIGGQFTQVAGVQQANYARLSP